MIIKRKEAWKLDGIKLAELASEYATSFAKKLGYEKEITVRPGRVLHDPKEALDSICRRISPSIYPPNMIDWMIEKNDIKRAKINNYEPFFVDGIAYTPLALLGPEERELILEAAANTSHYLLLKGFGPEMGHLVGEILYDERLTSGLSETLDLLSGFHELEVDVATLNLSKRIIAEKAAEYIENLRGRVDSLEKMMGLEKDEKKISPSAKEDMIEGLTQHMTDQMLKPQIGDMKKDYVQTKHYGGMKLFIEVYDHCGLDLERTFLHIGKMFSNPEVRAIDDALRELGWSEEKLAKYMPRFDSNIYNRARLVNY